MGDVREITAMPRIRGSLSVPGDKSISHRAVMLASIAEGKSHIRGFLRGVDTLSTLSLFRQLGVEAEEKGEELIINGKGREALREPTHVLQVGNSGTTIRLTTGLLAGSPFYSVLDGDDSIARRPMRRVVDPLRLMGAQIDGRKNGEYTPIAIRGRSLSPLEYRLPVASAQVKSALILAALTAEGESRIIEPTPTRDHSERMLRFFGANLQIEALHADDSSFNADGADQPIVGGKLIRIPGGSRLSGQAITIPGDISSAAFFLVLAAIHPDAELTLKGIGINPTRTGILEALQQMGASIKIENLRDAGGEPVADLTVYSSRLRGITIGGEMIPRLIDEIPILAVAATQAEGTTLIRDAEELKVKESDRITAMVTELKKLGARIEGTPDGMIIEGPTPLHGGDVEVYHDHRIAMSMAVAGCVSQGDSVRIHHPEIAVISFPGFYDLLEGLQET